MAYQIINRGLEVFGQLYKGVQVGLCAVVFVFIYRLLCRPDNIGQLLLAYALSKTKLFQVLYQNYHLTIIY